MANNIPSEYWSEPLELKEGYTVHPHAQHYLVSLRVQGRTILSPTQGALVHLGIHEETDEEVWAYLRWHTKPMYLHTNPDLRMLLILQDKDVDEDLKARAETLAKTRAVYDRRHERFDEDYHTPGGAQKGWLGCLDSHAHDEALRSTGAALG